MTSRCDDKVWQAIGRVSLPRTFLHALSIVLPLVAMPSYAWGAESSLATQQLISASLDEQKMAKSGERQNLVLAAKNFCDEVKQAFPANSPSEERWLSEEIVAGGPRTIRALGSAEFGRHKAKNFGNNCLSAAQGYLGGKPEHRTMAIISLAHAFAVFAADAEIHARNNGIDPGRFASAILDFPTRTIIYAALQEEVNSQTNP